MYASVRVLGFGFVHVPNHCFETSLFCSLHFKKANIWFYFLNIKSLADYTIDFYSESIPGPWSGTRSGSAVLGDVTA